MTLNGRFVSSGFVILAKNLRILKVTRSLVRKSHMQKSLHIILTALLTLVDHHYHPTWQALHISQRNLQ
jgi:hypothetical protein